MMADRSALPPGDVGEDSQALLSWEGWWSIACTHLQGALPVSNYTDDDDDDGLEIRRLHFLDPEIRCFYRLLAQSMLPKRVCKQ